MALHVRPATIGVWLLLGSLLTPAALCAQRIGTRDSDSLEFPRRGSASAGQGEAQPDLSRVEELIVERTNDFRQEHGLEPVQTDPNLEEAAEYFAHFMARTDKYGHTADENQPWERAEMHGYEYCIVSENIAYRYSSAGFTTRELARGFMRGWIESPPHRENILDPDVTEIGVAVAHSEETGNYYAVQMFGRPKSMQFKFQIANRSGETFRYRIGDQTFRLPPRYTRTHQRCRPAELEFLFSGPEGEEQGGPVFHPEGGEEYVVRQGPSGELRVQKREADPESDAGPAPRSEQ